MDANATEGEVPPQPAPGLACGRCGCQHLEVVYTRRWTPGKIVRRRECRNCGKRLTTIEEERVTAPERTGT